MLHIRADYALSSRNYFTHMPLPFTFFSGHTDTHTHKIHLVIPLAIPSLSRGYRAAFYKIYVCRRTGDVAAGYLFFR